MMDPADDLEVNYLITSTKQKQPKLTTETTIQNVSNDDALIASFCCDAIVERYKCKPSKSKSIIP